MVLLVVLYKVVLTFKSVDETRLVYDHSMKAIDSCCTVYLAVDGGSNFTAPFNNMRTLKFKARPTDEFFATVNQMFGGSSQLPATAEHCFVV